MTENMQSVGVIGIGDMGSGLAKNLMAAGHTTYGFDVDAGRLDAFASAGGVSVGSAAEVGASADTVFVMVMTGEQAKSAILGDGLVSTMVTGGTIIVTATIHPAEVKEIEKGLAGSGLNLVDSPVTGGFAGAQNGTLTLMAAGSDEAMIKARATMEAVSATIHRVGDEIGMGQTVKACLQILTGTVFTAACEASVLAARNGVSGQVLHDVVSTSAAGSLVASMALQNITDRKFEGGGARIDTTYKDLTIALDLARNSGVPLFTAGTALQLFQAGKTAHPDGDNWAIARVLEDIAGPQSQS